MTARGILAASALVLLGACGPLSGVGAAALGGGPNVAANVQAGAENRQSGVAIERRQEVKNSTVRTIEQSTAPTNVRTERVERVTVRNEAPPWVWALAILGWLLPSPREIGVKLGARMWGRRNAD